MVACHLRALVRGQFIGRPEGVPTTVDVKHDGTLSAQARRPNVQFEQILALPPVIPVLNESLFGTGPGMQILRTVCPIYQRGIFILPWSGRLGREPPVLSSGSLTVRHTLE